MRPSLSRACPSRSTIQSPNVDEKSGVVALVSARLVDFADKNRDRLALVLGDDRFTPEGRPLGPSRRRLLSARSGHRMAIRAEFRASDYPDVIKRQ